MAQLISASLDLKKIDKSKITEKGNGKYLGITISVNDTTDTYGNNVSVYIEQTKEERERKDKKVYLGNGKVFWTSNETPNTAPAQAQASSSNDEDGLPF